MFRYTYETSLSGSFTVFSQHTWWSYSITMFTNSEYREAFNLFFTAFSRVSDFVSISSCCLKIVLSVYVASWSNFTNFALTSKKYLDFSLIYLLEIEKHFYFAIISHCKKTNKNYWFYPSVQFLSEINTPVFSTTPSVEYFTIPFAGQSCFIYELSQLITCQAVIK